MADRPMTVVRACDGHRRKVLDPTNSKHVEAQLQAEGHKRLEAFVFEQLFTRAVAQFFEAEDISLGWSFQYDDNNVPRYWFKFVVEEEVWRLCDGEITSFLAQQGCSVIWITYDFDSHTFYASQYNGDEWGATQTLDEVLSALLGSDERFGSVRNYSNINQSAQDEAVRAIKEIFSDDELYHLSLSRTLTNCYLAPWFNKQPMDIDACYCVEGIAQFVEFKRKYPAQSGEFGIDEHPHGMLSDWLEQAGAVFYHVILCDPLWNKNVSPLHMLEDDSVTAEYAVWLGVILDSSAFTGGSFRTAGADSGMFGGERQQRRIRAEALKLVGEGMFPHNLRDFLLNPLNVPAATVQMLVEARDSARAVYFK